MFCLRWGTCFLTLLSLAPLLAAVWHNSTAPHGNNVVPPRQIWGPYRPNLYLGVRPQIPETFLMGLMWASGESRDKMLKSTYPPPERHAPCNEE